METAINLAWVVGIIAISYFAIKWFVIKLKSNKAKEDLEMNMANINNENYVRTLPYVKALLLIRGHFLSRELRVAAENWVEEMEEKLKGK